MKKLLLLLLLCSVSAQNIFTDFFKHSTAYSSFFVTSPMRENDRFQLVTDDHGSDFWNSANMHMERIDRVHPFNYSYSVGLRKIARFNYDPKRGVKHAGNGGEWYDGTEWSPNESAPMGRRNGWEYLIKFTSSRSNGVEFSDQEYWLRHIGDWHIIKASYTDLQHEKLQYMEADLRLKKEFYNFNFSAGISYRTHPAYGVEPWDIDDTWFGEGTAWWNFVEEELGWTPQLYYADTDLDGVYDAYDGEGDTDYDWVPFMFLTGWEDNWELFQWFQVDWTWSNPDSVMVAHSDREFFLYHFPYLLEGWFDKKVNDLGIQREVSLVLGADYYKHTDTWWVHSWASFYPVHKGLDEWSFDYKEEPHENEEEIVNLHKQDKSTFPIWLDVNVGTIVGFKLTPNIGVFAEGRYIKFWDNPAYDFKLGLNYQFKW